MLRIHRFKKLYWLALLTVALLLTIWTQASGRATYETIMGLGGLLILIPPSMQAWGFGLNRGWRVILYGTGFTAGYWSSIAALSNARFASAEPLLLFGFPFGILVGILLCREWHQGEVASTGRG